MKGPQFSILNKGGHITQWQPDDQPSGVLFCSALADLHGPKAVRGGIPVCWPWFGPRQGHAQHGFVRTLPWQLEIYRECEGMVSCAMTINSSEENVDILEILNRMAPLLNQDDNINKNILFYESIQHLFRDYEQDGVMNFNIQVDNVKRC